MRTFKLTKMSGKGDELVAEWTETTSPAELEKIEAEFNQKMAEGYFAANLETNEIVDKFDPKVDMLLIPRMQGGLL